MRCPSCAASEDTWTCSGVLVIWCDLPECGVVMNDRVNELPRPPSVLHRP